MGERRVGVSLCLTRDHFPLIVAVLGIPFIVVVLGIEMRDTQPAHEQLDGDSKEGQGNHG